MASTAATAADIDLLVRCTDSQRDKFLNDVVDELCERRCCVYGSDLSCWNLHEWNRLVKSTKALLLRASDHNSKESDLLWDESLVAYGVSADCTTALRKVLLARKSDINTALINSISRISSFTLSDFDWKINMSLASDKLAKLNEPSLLLDISLLLPDGTIKKITLDICKEKLSDLIEQLEIVSANMNKLKA